MTTPLITAFEYKKRIERTSAVATAIVEEALCSKHFRSDLPFKHHRVLIAQQLLAVHRPALLGELAALFERNESELAVETAIKALLQLKAQEPVLFWNSRINQAQTRAWMRRGFSGRDPNEVAGLVDRADELERLRLRHECARRLAAEGRDVEAIRAEIDAKCPLEGTTEFYQRALAQTPKGVIAGAGPQNLDNGEAP